MGMFGVARRLVLALQGTRLIAISIPSPGWLLPDIHTEIIMVLSFIKGESGTGGLEAEGLGGVADSEVGEGLGVGG